MLLYVTICNYTYTNFVQAAIAYHDIITMCGRVNYVCSTLFILKLNKYCICVPLYTPFISNFHVFITYHATYEPHMVHQQIMVAGRERYVSTEWIVVLVGVSEGHNLSLKFMHLAGWLSFLNSFSDASILQHSHGGFSMCGLGRFSSVHCKM